MCFPQHGAETDTRNSENNRSMPQHSTCGQLDFPHVCGAFESKQHPLRVYKVYRVCFFSKSIASQPRFCRLHWMNASDTVGADFPHVNVLFRPKQQESQVTAITKTPKNPKHQTQNHRHKTKKTKPWIQNLAPKPKSWARNVEFLVELFCFSTRTMDFCNHSRSL